MGPMKERKNKKEENFGIPITVLEEEAANFNFCEEWKSII